MRTYRRHLSDELVHTLLLDVQAFLVLLIFNSPDSDETMAYQQKWYSNDHRGADSASTCSGSRDDHS